MRWIVKEMEATKNNLGFNFYVKDTTMLRAIGVPGDMVIPERQLTQDEAVCIVEALNSLEILRLTKYD